MRPAVVTLQTLAIGTIGGLVFNAVNFPMAWLIGALLACVCAAAAGIQMRIPDIFREVMQPILGVALGSYFAPSLLDDIGRWPGVVTMVAVFAGLGTLAGYFYFNRIAGYSRITSFFASTPGGLSDLTLVGASMGASIIVITIVHSLRMLLIVVAMPLILLAVGGVVVNTGVRLAAQMSPYDAAIAVACGIAGYFGARLLRIPAGPIIGPLILSGAAHVTGLTKAMPPDIAISIVQIVLGAFIGTHFVGLRWQQFRHAALHGLIWSTLLLLLGIVFSVATSWLTGLGLPQLLLAFAPGGIAEMAVLTLAVGIDVAVVTICHIVRLLIVYSAVPVIGRHLRKYRDRQEV